MTPEARTEVEWAIRDLGLDPKGLSGAELVKLLEAEIERLRRALRGAARRAPERAELSRAG